MALVLTVDDGAGVKIGGYTVYASIKGGRVCLRMADVPTDVKIVRVAREPDVWEKLAMERRQSGGGKPGGFDSC